MGLISSFIVEKITSNVNNFEGSRWDIELKKHENENFKKWLHERI